MKKRSEGVPAGTVLVALLALIGTAHSQSGLDPFSTGKILRRDTSGYSDPTGHACVVVGPNLTFAGAVDRALCANPQTRTAWAQAHEQAGALGREESAWLPQVTATGQGDRQFGQHTDADGELVSSAQNSADAVANLTWTLYDFGNRSARIESAHRLLDAAAATASSTVQATIRAVVQAYYGAVAGDAGLAAAKITEEISAHSLAIARALQTGGVGALGDVLQAQTAYQQAVLARVQAEASAQSARGTLSVTMGNVADETFTLLPDAIPNELSALNGRIRDLMDEAARQRPDLAAARLQRDAAEANVTVAKAVGRPSIAFGALRQFNYASGDPNENYTQIGLTVTVPIFSGFNVTYGVRQAKSALQVAEANLDQVGLNVTLDVWNGYHNMVSANDQLSVTADLLKTAEENEQVSIGRYQAGVGSIVDVLTAQAALATARQLRINAELGWWVSRASLAFALGRLSSAAPLEVRQPLPQRVTELP